jgi:hypothetical protein
MKKIYVLLLSSLIVSMSFAQVSNTKRIESIRSTRSNSMVKEKVEKQASPVLEQATICTDDVVETSFKSLSDAVNAHKVKAADLEVLYSAPEGTFFEGFSRIYRSWQATYLHSPAMVAVDYEPYVNEPNATFVWHYNGGSQAEITDPMDADGTLHFTSGITPEGYINFLPKVTATTATGSASFVLGQNVASQYLMAASVERAKTEDGTDFDGQDEFAPLTLVDINVLRPASGNLYTGYSTDKFFGPAYSNTDGACVGVMQVIPQLKSPLYVESISVLAYSAAAATAVPAGGVLKLEIYYLNTNGSLGTKIAESTTNEFVVTTTNGQQGVFIFKFEEEEDGFIFDAPITIGTDALVAVRITGFDSTWDFRFLLGTADGWVGSAYSLHGSNLKVATFGYTDSPNIPATHLHIQYNGILNCLVPYDDYGTITAPTEGGWVITDMDEANTYNDYAFYSSYNVDEDMTDVWIESGPSWINYAINPEDAIYFDEYNIAILYFQAEPLPAGLEGRYGEIVVSSYGVSVTIPVIQGNPTGVTTPKTSEVKASYNNNSFVLSYTDQFNSVSVYDVAGKQIGTYALPKSGNFSIPASDLTNGVYIVRFAGESNAAVKVVK